MSDLLRLLQQLGDGEHDDISVAYDALAEIVDLRMQLAETKKDADRYQYVRNCGWEFIGEDRGVGPEWPHCEELDVAVDSAIKALKSEEDK